MSSYQFVNSLASSCYGRAGTAGAAGGDLSGMTAADYYASAMSSYQQNCYPVAGQQQQQQQQQQHYADFGQHQQQQHMPMSPMSSNGGVDFNAMTAMQQQQPIMQQQQARLQQQQQPLQQQQTMRGPSVQQQRLNSVASPVHLGTPKRVFFIGRGLMNFFLTFQGGSSTPSSCKYAVVPDKCLGSPQDLSLTHLTAAGPPVLTSAAVPTASSSSSGKHEHKSGGSGKSSHHQQQRHKAAAVGASSPSSVSSVSSGSSDPQSPGGQGDGKNPNAPQIYPWMKRVHLGQSKSSIKKEEEEKRSVRHSRRVGPLTISPPSFNRYKRRRRKKPLPIS